MKPKSHQPETDTDEDQAKRRAEAIRCSWMTSGNRCYLIGTWGPDTAGHPLPNGTVRSPRAFCAYHADALLGKGARSAREFGEWLLTHLENFPPKVYGYRSAFAVHQADSLWSAVNGRFVLPEVAATEALDPGVRSRELHALVMGGKTEGLLSKVLDGRMQLEVAQRQIQETADRIKRDRDSEVFE